MFKRRKPDGSPPADPPADAAPGMREAPSVAGPGPRGADTRFAESRSLDPRGPDTGLGVPPFRPAPSLPSPAPFPPALSSAASKESQAMGRAPFSPNPVAVPPASAAVPVAVPAVRLSGRPTRDPAERRQLTVGRGISLQGTVQDAERLVVEGTIEATMIHATELSVAHGGVFKGEIEVEDAEIAGTVDGTLTARGNLVLRATGRLLGTARCRRLQVEDGGQISGRMEMIGEPAKALAEPIA
jgi:cytoskeletal protein CcmA (bactofilin family)